MARGLVSPGGGFDLHPEDEDTRLAILFDALEEESVAEVSRGKFLLASIAMLRGGAESADHAVDSFGEYVERIIPYVGSGDDGEGGEGDPGSSWNNDFAEKHRRLSEAMSRENPRTAEEFLKMRA